jgi:hypothetical protein
MRQHAESAVALRRAQLETGQMACALSRRNAAREFAIISAILRQERSRRKERRDGLLVKK